MQYKYCPRCGGKLILRYIDHEKRERLICSKCNEIFYLNAKPTAAVVIRRDNAILFVKRKFEPHKGAWSLPGGFVEYDETVTQAGIREVKEETNLDIRIKRLLDIHSAFNNPERHVLVVGLEGVLLGGAPNPGDDAAEVRFFDIDHLPENIAWHCHLHFVRKALIEEESNL